LEAEVRFRK